MRLHLYIVAGFVALVAAGCDWTDMSPVEEQVVVEAYLVAGEELPTIRLTWSSSVDGVYDPQSRAVTDAVVSVARVDAAGAEIEEYLYLPSNAHPLSDPSLYAPVGRSVVVPGATYALRVGLPDGGLLTSETTVPDTLAVIAVSRDTTIYEEEQIELTLSRSEYPGRQAYLIFTASALDASEANATPITLRLLEEDDDLSVDELRITSSPPINESTYLDGANEPLTIPVPWLAVRFYGDHVVQISAIDDNLYDFLRSQLVQQGGSTFLPGEVPNILDRVVGGTGVFGSYAAASTHVYVARPAE